MIIFLRILRAISGFIFASSLIQLGFITLHITGLDANVLSDFEIANIQGFAFACFLAFVIFCAVFVSLRPRINSLFSKKHPGRSLPLNKMWKI